MTCWQQLISYLICAACFYVLIREAAGSGWRAAALALVWPLILVIAAVKFVFTRERWY